jgi:hypothetical protein
MIDVYVLDGDLKIIGIIDAYKSLIWAKRYSETGDCEIYAPATRETIELFKKGRYLARLDDDMICRINKLQVTTSVEDGDYITTTGTDTKAFLDQRIIWGTATCSGNIEEIARTLVQDSCITPDNPDRALAKSNDEPLVILDEPAGLSTIVCEQVSYKSVGEKIREYCTAYGCGYRFRGDLGNRVLKFGMYAGVDRRLSVIFSDAYDNLANTNYTEDETRMANTALIGGTGEGADRILDVYGGGYGVDRYEQFVDASDISPEITFGELKNIYPLIADGGTAYIQGSGENWSYIVGVLDIQVMSEEQLADLKTEHPGGTEITISGHLFYRLTDTKAASMTAQAPEDDASVTLEGLIYDVYLLNRGKEKLSEYGRVETFDGQIIPDVTFVYKTDYDLGDLVTIENKYGIKSGARITEIIEVLDTETGHTIEPTFEMVEAAEGRPVGAANLTTEGDDDIETENNNQIMIEGE